MFKRPTVDSIIRTFTDAVNSLDVLIYETKESHDAKAEMINRLDEQMAADAVEVNRAMKIRSNLNDMIV